MRDPAFSGFKVGFGATCRNCCYWSFCNFEFSLLLLKVNLGKNVKPALEAAALFRSKWCLNTIKNGIIIIWSEVMDKVLLLIQIKDQLTGHMSRDALEQPSNLLRVALAVKNVTKTQWRGSWRKSYNRSEIRTSDPSYSSYKPMQLLSRWPCQSSRSHAEDNSFFIFFSTFNFFLKKMWLLEQCQTMQC